MNSIFKRRSIRKFIGRPVEDEKIKLMLKAGMCAPSAYGQSEWEYVVVTDRSQIERLAGVHPHTIALKTAPLAIVPVIAGNRITRNTKYCQQDMAAATENILVEAVELGLGAVWMGIMPEEDRIEKAGKVLGLPENVKAFCMIAVGYPENEPEYMERYAEDRVHYNHY